MEKKVKKKTSMTKMKMRTKTSTKVAGSARCGDRAVHAGVLAACPVKRFAV